MNPFKNLLAFVLLFTVAHSYAKEILSQPNLGSYNNKVATAELLFIENKGQLQDTDGCPRPDILFSSRSNGAKVFISANAIHYQFGQHIVDFHQEQIFTSLDRFSIELLGANPNPEIVTPKAELYTENYYNEQFPEGLMGVRSFREIILKDIYPGIDWVIYSKGKFIEYDFIVHPGADPGQIRFKVAGAEDVALTEQGALLLKACYGEVYKHAPVSFVGEEIIASSFEVLDDGSFGYVLAAYALNETLRIDPFMEWGTYYGGVYEEIGEAVAIDSLGNVYLAGSTKSNNGIATGLGVHDNSYSSINGNASYDAFLVKFNTAGQRIWGTYYGGTANDMVVDVITDASGVYLIGATVLTSSTTATMNTDNSSTHYVGGVQIDGNYGDQLGTIRNPHLARPGYNDVTGESDQMATFVAKFQHADGSRIWGQLYGCSRKNTAWSVPSYNPSEPVGMAIDGTTGELWLLQNMYFKFNATTEALGTIFSILGIIPGMPPAAKMVIKVADVSFRSFVKPGETSCFSVAKLNQDNGEIRGDDIICSENASRFPLVATAIASGKENGRDIYITAYTSDNTLEDNLGEANIPLKVNGGDNFRDEKHSQVVIYHLKDTATSQYWPEVRRFAESSRFFGTAGVSEIPTSIVVDNRDNNHIYVGGTTSGAIPLMNAWDNSYNGGSADGFIAKFDMGNGNLLWSTYLGGGGEDIVQSLSLSPDRFLYATGTTTSSTGFASVSGRFSGGDRDAFLSKFSFLGDRVWSSFIGGSGYDYGASVATHGKDVYVSGLTGSTAGLTGGNGFKVNYDNGAQEAFLLKFNNLSPGDNGIIYVRQGGTGGGSNWASATGDLHGAITTAGVKQVWVAAGTYQRPSGLSFTLVDDVKIFGGFPASGSPTFEERDWIGHPTVLLGNGNSVIRANGGLWDFSSRLDGFIIRNGNSAEGGGGLWCDAEGGGGLFVIANCTFENNTSSSSSGGGAIGLLYSSPRIINCRFINNTAIYYGGAIYNNNWSSPSITGCSFTGNSTTYNGSSLDYGLGGAIHSTNNSLPYIGNCEFVNNHARFGGALFQQNDVSTYVARINNCTFSGNSAAYDGGAIYAESRGLFHLNACLFTGNTAARNGGGMFNTSSGYDYQYNNVYSKAYNCLFSGNTAASGGGLYSGGFEAANLTVTGNNASVNGGGIFVSDFGFKLINSIVYGNSSNIFSNVSGSSAPVVTYSLIQGGYTGAGNFNADPLFIDPKPFGTAPRADGNYKLLACSPAINAGLNTAMPVGINTDLDGGLRIQHGAIDLGAFENQIENFSTDANGILYVSEFGLGDGSSWNQATSDLSGALIMAQCDTAVQQIWVSQGTYRPTLSPADSILGQPAGRENAFLLARNVKLFGGFSGNETSIAQRRIASHETILSGDLNTLNEDSDNAYHVIVIADSNISNTNTILDGFTIVSGNANGMGAATINGYSVSRSEGGGLVNVGGSPRISNCKFMGNQAVNGGAVSNRSAASPLFTNNLFAGNVATTGGAMANFNCTNVVISQSTFAGNKATEHSGAALFYDASPINLRNSLVSGNSGGITGPAFTSAVAFNQIQGRSADGFNNINGALDPKFVNNPGFNAAPFTEGSFEVTGGSSVMNKGNNAYISSFINQDLAGNPRIFFGQVDLGAYELQAAPDTLGIVYVRKGVTGNGSSWSHPLPELADALVLARRDTTVRQIWVAAGTYRPFYSPADNNFGTSDGANNTFLLVNNVKVLGGFTGSETNAEARRPDLNITVLDGDRVGVGNNSDKVLHVVTAVGSDSVPLSDTTALDGFTIINGWANTSVSGVVVNGITLQNSEGGGIYNIHSNATFSNLQIKGNSAISGGGVCNKGSGAPAYTNSLISGNQGITNGGACFNQATAPVFTNLTISGNQSGGAGAVRNVDASPVFRNTIVLGNRLPAWSDQNSSLQFINSLAEQRTTTDANGNLAVVAGMPVFVNPLPFSSAPALGGNYDLLSNSAVIDRGNNALISGIEHDLAGESRVFFGTVDMGAYEFISKPDANGILYVKQNAGGKGTSWATAMGSVQQALNTPGVQQVWVAGGTYFPEAFYGTGNQDRDRTFLLKPGIKLYGGFAGTESTVAQRVQGANETVLSGNLGAQENSVDNAYHVIVADGSDIDSLSVLDGFTISGGNANGTSERGHGGGILIKDGASLSLSNLRIIDNAAILGGGAYVSNANPQITNTIISGNSAQSGGGLYHHTTVKQPQYINVLISGNAASTTGGAMVNESSSPIFTNVTFSGNQSVGAGVARNISADPIFRNTISVGNSLPAWSDQSSSKQFFHSIAEQATTNDGNGNLAADTSIILFLNPLSPAAAPTTGGDYGLLGNTPAVDAGNSAFVSGQVRDLNGRARISFSSVDMGAYEYFATPDANGIIYVRENSTGNGSSWTNAMGNLQNAIFTTGVQQVWVAAGTYKPSTIFSSGSSNRDKSFQLRQGVKVYGGFAGNESSLSQRDWFSNETILSGDLGIQGDTSDNTYHVVASFTMLNSNTELDGFTITGGNANGPPGKQLGGGVYLTGSSSPILRNLKIVNNHAGLGGGLFVAGPSPRIINTVISANTATYGGGVGINTPAATPEFINVLMSGNRAVVGGGGVYALSSAATFTNVTITGNHSSSPVSIGGGIYEESNLSNNGLTITNSIIYNNSAVNGVGMATDGNPVISHSLIQGYAGGTNGNLDGNLAYDNLFVAPVAPSNAPTMAGDYRLGEGNPLSDAGNSMAPGLVGISTDLAGQPRVTPCAVDLGAYEGAERKTQIPDPNFEAYLESQGWGDGLSGNGLVRTCEIEKVTNLMVAGLNIGSLEGIQDFRALQFLFCFNNNITALDFSQNTALVTLLCFNNQLKSLSVNNSNNQNLWNFNALANPDLLCIEVDDPTAYYLAFWAKPETTAWGANCCKEPEGLVSEVLNSNAANLSFTSDGLTSRVSYRPLSTTLWTNVVINSTAQTVFIQSLAPGTTYEWRVTSFCNPEKTISVTSKLDTFATPAINICPSPTNLVSTVINSNAVRLSWSGEALTYRAFFRAMGTTRWTLAPMSNAATTIDLRSLLPGTVYQWKVLAYCNAERTVISDDSAIESFTTLSQNLCPSPSNLSVTVLNSNAVQLSWSGEGHSYNIFQRVSGSVPWRVVAWRSVDTSMTLRSLLAGTNYEWKVVAFCDAERLIGSDESPVSQFTTAATNTCATPISMGAWPLNSNSMHLTWFTAGNVRSTIYFRESGMNVWRLTQVNNNLNAFQLSGLRAGTTYEWKVVAFCNPEGTVFSEESEVREFTTPETNICNTPDNLTSFTVNSNAVQLSWTGTGIRYSVSLRPVGTLTWRRINISGADTTVNVSALLPATTYEWTVTATCNDEFGFTHISELSPAALFTTPSENICPQPGNLSSEVINSNAVTLSWQGQGQAHRVLYSEDGSTVWRTVMVNNATTQANLSGLQAGSQYHWKVVALCESNILVSSEESATATFITNSENSCLTPVNLAAEVLNSNAVRLTWTSTGVSHTIQFRTLGSTVWRQIVLRTQDTTTVVRNLDAGTAYEWRVQAFCDNNRRIASDRSIVETFTTNIFNSCQSPFWPESDVLNSNSVRLQWWGFGPSFLVYFRPVGTQTWRTQLVNNACTGTCNLSAVVKSLLPGTQYEWKVIAHCSADRTIYSNDSQTGTFTTLEANICPSPEVLPAEVLNNNAARVTWTGSGEVYTVYHREIGATVWRPTVINNSASSVVLRALIPETSYEWKVVSFCSADRSVASDASQIDTFTTLAVNLCAASTNLSETVLNSNAAELSWIGTGVSYTVLVSQVGQIPLRTIQVNTTNTSVVIRGLLADTEYEWKVVTNCTSDRSVYSEESGAEIFTTSPDNICATPANLTSDILDSISVQLNWNSVGLRSTVFFRREGTAAWTARLVNSPATTVTLNNLNKAARYQWRVITFCEDVSNIYSDSSSIAIFETPGYSPCPTPTGLIVFVNPYEGLSFEWSGTGLSYIVSVRQQGEVDWYTVSSEEQFASVWWWDLGLFEGGGIFEWKVRAVCSTDGTVASEDSPIATINSTSPDRMSDKQDTTSVNMGNPGIPSLSIQSYALYPNPARNKVTVSLQVEGIGDISIRILFLDGSVAKERIIRASNGVMIEEVELSEFPKGMYIVQISSNDGISKTLPLVVH